MTNTTKPHVRRPGVGPRTPKPYLDQGRVREQAVVQAPKQPNYVARRIGAAVAALAAASAIVFGVVSKLPDPGMDTLRKINKAEEVCEAEIPPSAFSEAPPDQAAELREEAIEDCANTEVFGTPNPLTSVNHN